MGSKKRRLKEFDAVGKPLNPQAVHSKNMRSFEMSFHFGGQSIIHNQSIISRSRSRYEGGNTGTAMGEDEDLGDIMEIMMEEEEMMSGLKGTSAANEVVMNAIIAQEVKVNLGGLDLEEINFLRDHMWPTLEEINLSNNMLQNIDLLNEFKGLVRINAFNN